MCVCAARTCVFCFVISVLLCSVRAFVLLCIFCFVLCFGVFYAFISVLVCSVCVLLYHFCFVLYFGVFSVCSTFSMFIIMYRSKH